MDAKLVGRLLFGRSPRLALAVWIFQHSKPDFYQSQPPPHVVRQSDAANELERLVTLGMIEREQRPDSRRVYYVRNDENPLWAIIAAAAEVVTMPGPADEEA